MVGWPRTNFWTVIDMGCFLTPFFLSIQLFIEVLHREYIMKVKIKKSAPNEYIYITRNLTQNQDSPRPQESSSCSLQSWFFPQLTTTMTLSPLAKFYLFLNLLSREHRTPCFASGFSFSKLFMTLNTAGSLLTFTVWIHYNVSIPSIFGGHLV